jgi:pSer/pThr/pTyr-binding forkhead associated (FHA) protein
MASAASTPHTDAQTPTEPLELPGVLGNSARRDSLAFARPAPGRYLAIEDGDVTRLVALRGRVTHLGRGFSADLRLEDQSVSRRHAVIVDDGEGTRILDDRSANGTFVNSRRVTEAPLHDRDVIRLGRVALIYRAVAG